MRTALALLLFAAVLPSWAAGIRGTPLMQRYTAEDYLAAPVHLAVQADADGTVYIGNVEGVLRFDGSQWSVLELPGRSPARSLARGADGRIYVGGYDHFGVIEALPTGERRYRDLRQAFELDNGLADVADVWSVVPTSAGVYFRATRTLFFHGFDGSVAQWPLGEDVRGVRAVGDVLFARVDGVGLARFENGRLLPVPGAAVFAERPLFAMFERADGSLLVADDGFYLADPLGIRKLPGDAGRIFAASPPYTAIQLADGSYALGTYNGEVLRFDRDLRLQQRHALGSYTILAMGLDHEGGLWAATEGDLVRLRMPSPWSAFTAADGLQGSLTDCAWHDDTLWVANSMGVARAELDELGKPRFRQAIRTELEAYDLESDPAGLLIGERDGVLWLPRGASEPVRVVEMTSAYTVMHSPFDPDTVFVHGEEAIVRLVRRGRGWDAVATWPLEGVAANTLEQTAPDTLWLGDSRGGPVRWTLSDDGSEVVERRRFGADSGLEVDPEFGTTLLRLDGRVLVVSGQRAFVFEGERFSEDGTGPIAQVERPMELVISETAVGTYAYTWRELLLRAPGEREWRPVILGSRLARGYGNVHADADGLVRMVTWNGLLQYDPGVAEAPLPPLAVHARVVEVREPGAQPRLLPLDTAATPPPDIAAPTPLAPGTQMRFAFSLPTMEPGAQVRWRIRGMAEAWSDWDPVGDASIMLRAVDGGDYRLEVEGRMPSGRPVEPLSYRFAASPHWWQTPAAWIAAALLLGALVVLGSQVVARIRYRQFVAVNRRLEDKIAARTRELEDANRKLEELATEDSLTGVANRRALELGLQREWERCAELGVPLAVVMIDVDHFKQFNDRHGHLEGDKRLRWVAQRLAAQVRPVRELLARFGGEEFALVLPGHGVDEAMDRAERLRRGFETDDSGLTVSLGVAVAVPRADGEPSELVRSADAALYQAKRNGRNRVELARR